MTHYFSRRALLASPVIMAVSQTARKASADEAELEVHNRPSDVAPKVIDYDYEISYSEEEWKKRLSAEDFHILREGGTEKKKSSPLWQEKRSGSYSCKGCDLGIYDSEYKVILNKGWAFFRHCEPDSVLTGIDLYTSYGSKKKITAMEAHCRRCGSHFGHILYIKGEILHCINGASLIFKPSTV